MCLSHYDDNSSLNINILPFVRGNKEKTITKVSKMAADASVKVAKKASSKIQGVIKGARNKFSPQDTLSIPDDEMARIAKRRREEWDNQNRTQD